MKNKKSIWLFVVLGYISSLFFMGFAFYLSSIQQPSYTQTAFHKEALEIMDKEMLMNHYKAYDCFYVKEMYLEAKDPIEETSEEKGFLMTLINNLAKRDYCGSFYDEDWTMNVNGMTVSHDKIHKDSIDNQSVINERINYIVAVMIILILSWEIDRKSVV